MGLVRKQNRGHALPSVGMDLLWMDPVSGDIECLVPGEEPGTLRVATDDDVLESFILSRAPFEEASEFDFRSDHHASYANPVQSGAPLP